MKLIIDIPKDLYDMTRTPNNVNYIMRMAGFICSAIAEGTPLDDLKEEIEQDMSFDMFDDYGNKTRIHKELWEIFDNIGKESEEV